MTLVTTAIAVRYARVRHHIAVLTALAVAVGASVLVIVLPVLAAFSASVVTAIAWCIWLQHDEVIPDRSTPR